MKLSTTIKSCFVDTTCLVYVFLFVYAGVSKLLDFENFQVQLGQSPLLSTFASPVSFGVISIELVLAFLLLFASYRTVALYGSFLLMVMFTTYIIIIINFSSFVPCSCGGILEKMSWTDHLIFNIAFVVLALLALFLESKSKFVFWYILLHFIAGIGIVTLLFILSEDSLHHRNTFVRRFIAHQVNKIHQVDLKYNSYYLAGSDSNQIYLGNYTNPSTMTVWNSNLKKRKQYTMKLNEVHIPFRAIQVKVVPPYFYVLDGTVPCIFKGTIKNWNASLIRLPGMYFSAVAIVNDTTMAIRSRLGSNNENILGLIEFGSSLKMQLKSGLLQKQMDGVFDTDGSLHYSKALQKLIYLYYYRNEFIVTNPQLQLTYRGKTIDTNSTAKLKITYLPKQGLKQFSAPPFTVNSSSAVHKNLLFVHSNLQGKFDSQKMWNQASVIDVYDIVDKSYRFSFYIYHVNGKKMKSFVVNDTHLYALIDNQMVVYSLATIFKIH